MTEPRRVVIDWEYLCHGIEEEEARIREWLRENQQETGKGSSAPSSRDRRAMGVPDDRRLPGAGLDGTGTTAA